MKRIDLYKFLEMEDGLQQLKWSVSDMKEKRRWLKFDIDNLAIDIKDAESLIKEIEQDKSHQYHIYQKIIFGDA